MQTPICTAGLHPIDAASLLFVSSLKYEYLWIGDSVLQKRWQLPKSWRRPLALLSPHKHILADLVVFFLHEMVEFDKIAILLTLF